MATREGLRFIGYETVSFLGVVPAGVLAGHLAAKRLKMPL